MGFGDFLSNLGQAIGKPFYEAAMYQSKGPNWKELDDYERQKRALDLQKEEEAIAASQRGASSDALRNQLTGGQIQSNTLANIGSAGRLYGQALAPQAEAMTHQVAPDQMGPSMPIPDAPDISGFIPPEMLKYADAIKALGMGEANTNQINSKYSLAQLNAATGMQKAQQGYDFRRSEGELNRDAAHEALLLRLQQSSLNRGAANDRSANSNQIKVWSTLFQEAAHRGEDLTQTYLKQRTKLSEDLQAGKISPEDATMFIGSLSTAANSAMRQAQGMSGGPSGMPGFPPPPPPPPSGSMMPGNYPVVRSQADGEKLQPGQKFYLPGDDILKVRTATGYEDVP